MSPGRRSPDPEGVRQTHPLVLLGSAVLGLVVGSLVVMAPALSYEASPRRGEWGALPELMVTYGLMALVLVVAGFVLLVAGRRRVGAVVGAGLLGSVLFGYAGAMGVFAR